GELRPTCSIVQLLPLMRLVITPTIAWRHTRSPHTGSGSGVWCSAKKPAASMLSGRGTMLSWSNRRKYPKSWAPPRFTLVLPGASAAVSLGFQLSCDPQLSALASKLPSFLYSDDPSTPQPANNNVVN